MSVTADVDLSVEGPDTDPVLDEVVADIVAQVLRLSGTPADAGEVRGLVEREWAGYADARVRAFLPVLVQRAVIRQVLGRVMPS